LGSIAEINQNKLMLERSGNIYKGNTRISKIYKGTAEVFNASPKGISSYPGRDMIAPFMGTGMADMMPDLVQQQVLIDLLNPVIDVLIN